MGVLFVEAFGDAPDANAARRRKPKKLAFPGSQLRSADACHRSMHLLPEAAEEAGNRKPLRTIGWD
jgi:hypothetical protein